MAMECGGKLVMQNTGPAEYRERNVGINEPAAKEGESGGYWELNTIEERWGAEWELQWESY